MAGIVFEEVREEHLSGILKIYNHYVVNSTATFHAKPLGEEEMRELLFFDNPRYTAYVIKDDGVICGYCILTQFKKREAYDCTAEITIYLKEDCMGRGIGSLAAGYIEKIALQRGIHSLVAIICGENTASIRMFEKNGYNQCAHYKKVGRKFDRFLDVVCYQKLLLPDGNL